jgi:large subunit ribosomal protein L25
MLQDRFEAQKRATFGKGAGRSLRRTGLIPAILYGRHQDVIPLQLDERAFQLFLRSNGENVLIDLDIGDSGTEIVMIKELQRDPVSHNILHTDFIRISMEDPITAAVPITLVGTSPGVHGEGGVLEFPHWELTVHCLPTLLPEGIEVDISNLEIGDFIRVEDLSVAEGIEMLDDRQTIVVLVNAPKVEVEPTPEEAEEAEEGVEAAEEETAAEEPELISRRRGEEE